MIPSDVPKSMQKEFENNYNKITHNTGKLMLFAGDQKVEHLNLDFYGDEISEDDNFPEHLFKIAASAKIGCFAAQMGLISRYASQYKDVSYLIKLNSKTNLVKEKDPISSQLWTIGQVMKLKKDSGLNILGIGYTIYIGSESENIMLKEAANAIFEAHQHGLVTVLWLYPRGKDVKDEKDPHLIAGACGIAACLGADFVKVNYPKKDGKKQEELFKEAIRAAGNTKVVCAGGSSTDARKFLTDLWNQLNISGAMGNATGRNIHQKSFDEAVRMCNAISAITLDGKSVDEAMKIYSG